MACELRGSTDKTNALPVAHSAVVIVDHDSATLVIDGHKFALRGAIVRGLRDLQKSNRN